MEPQVDIEQQPRRQPVLEGEKPVDRRETAILAKAAFADYARGLPVSDYSPSSLAQRLLRQEPNDVADKLIPAVTQLLNKVIRPPRANCMTFGLMATNPKRKPDQLGSPAEVLGRPARLLQEINRNVYDINWATLCVLPRDSRALERLFGHNFFAALNLPLNIEKPWEGLLFDPASAQQRQNLIEWVKANRPDRVKSAAGVPERIPTEPLKASDLLSQALTEGEETPIGNFTVVERVLPGRSPSHDLVLSAHGISLVIRCAPNGTLTESEITRISGQTNALTPSVWLMASHATTLAMGSL